MTQPWSQTEPRLNDYAGYAVTSGEGIMVTLIGVVGTFGIRNDSTSFGLLVGNFIPSPSSPELASYHLALGAPRAGADRSGTVFVVEYEGQEVIRKIKKLYGE